MVNTMTKKIVSLIIAIIILFLLLNWLFPDKINPDPVWKESKHLVNKVRSLFEDTPDEKDIPDVTPIDSIPTIKLQSNDKQQTNQNIAKPFEIDKHVDGYSKQTESGHQQIIEESESDNSKPKQNEKFSTQPLGPYSITADQIKNDEQEGSEASNVELRWNGMTEYADCSEIDKWQLLAPASCEATCDLNDETGEEMGLSFYCSE